ncbi:uncharacterized protein LOC17887727 [Capsella rubella]|uniref:uncharacterized protein LOC17887727 n=1 Tax=Capsella rubella TaxID=81985 RepID=UPI000CD5B20C|nr:uncharacterized protein LOC17887727 [Capsella rubella]
MADQEKLDQICDESSAEVSGTEKSTAAESSATPVTTIHTPCVLNRAPSTPPRSTIDAAGSSNPATELPDEVKKERIDQFRRLVHGMSLQEVVTFLQRFNWDLSAALNHHFEHREPQLYTSSHDYDGDDDNDEGYDDHDLAAMIKKSCVERISEAFIPIGFSEDVEMMDHTLPPLTSVGNSQIGSSPSSSGLMNVDVPGMGDLHDLPIMSSSQVQIQGSSSSAQIRKDQLPPYKIDTICKETGVCRYEALYYLQGFDWDLASALEACRNSTLPPLNAESLPKVSVNEGSVVPTSRPMVTNLRRRIMNDLRIQPEQLPPKSDELSSELRAENIKSFCDVTNAPPEVAEVYLGQCKWRVQDAINSFMDECFGNSNTQRISMGQSSSKSQFQASKSSSSSFMNVDPTETEGSILKKASDEGVPVAIPPLASSQVDVKLKGKAVEEDSRTDTITINFTFHDGTEANLPFRLDQTVRDIHSAIEARRPYDRSDFFLMSKSSDDCKGANMDTPVAKFCKGSTSFMQVYYE